MNLLGLELSDAGILVAGGSPPALVRLDEDSVESPGFALPEKKALITGKAAEHRARLFPRQIMNRFWDRLSTDPLEHPLPAAGNQAEVACSHLEHIWDKARHFGNALVVAAPGFFQRDQLGLLLGMAQELAIPVQGFVSLPVAAAGPGPEELHLHVDVHLHRFEVSVLKAGARLQFQEAITGDEHGLEALYKAWAQAAAAEFIRTTRFDPLHSAETEQELYRRLPSMLAALKHEQATTLTIPAGRSHYTVSLARGMILETARPVYDELLTAVHTARQRHAAAESPVTVQVSHRWVRLPDILERLGQMPNTRVVELPAGAAALALPALWRELTDGRQSGGAAFFNGRPWVAARNSSPAGRAAFPRRPTHLLYRNLAYPITANPLAIGSDPPTEGHGIRVKGDAEAIDSRHCMVQLRESQVVLTRLGLGDTLLNGSRIEGPTVVGVGDTIRLGKAGETIVAIACLDSNET
jgi:hypothetical protein